MPGMNAWWGLRVHPANARKECLVGIASASGERPERMPGGDCECIRRTPGKNAWWGLRVHPANARKECLVGIASASGERPERMPGEPSRVHPLNSQAILCIALLFGHGDVAPHGSLGNISCLSSGQAIPGDKRISGIKYIREWTGKFPLTGLVSASMVRYFW